MNKPIKTLRKEMINHIMMINNAVSLPWATRQTTYALLNFCHPQYRKEFLIKMKNNNLFIPEIKNLMDEIKNQNSILMANLEKRKLKIFK